MSLDRSRWFVSPDWLAARLADPDLVVVDGSWYLPTENRDPQAEYVAGHIPGAVRFDVDRIADTSSGLPHMLAAPDAFASAVGALGIGDGQTIVVYDGTGLFSAARVWWTFKVMGVADVYILDGGFPAWRAAGRPVETGTAARPARHFTARFDAGRVRDLAAVRSALADRSAQVVDARPGPRFRGEAPEPRPGVRSGHMAGALNLPFPEMIDGGRLASPEALAAAFAKAGVTLGAPVVTSCGSGVSAAILWLALETLGQPQDGLGLYDGSWAEWGSHPDTEVITG